MLDVNELIITMTQLVRTSEKLIEVLVEDEECGVLYEEQLVEAERQCNVARGVLLAMGRPVQD